MERLLLPLLAALGLLACTSSGPPSPAASAHPSAPAPSASPAITVRSPSELVLADADAGLPPVAARDHLGLTQAASEQQNQPLALTRYRTWGWVDESTRNWGGGSAKLDESLLLLSRGEGADLAFQSWSETLTERAPCPDGLGLDECAESAGALVGRVGPYTFRLAGSGVDLHRLARVQASRIRRH